jgi:tetratricopeptide (TPR) repeat protein
MPRLNFWQKSRGKSKHQPSQPPTGNGQGPDVDPQAVAQALVALLFTKSWDETRAVLEREHALLLTDTAEQILSELIQQEQQNDDPSRQWRFVDASDFVPLLQAQQSDDPSRQQQMNHLKNLMFNLKLLRAARAQGIYTAWEAFVLDDQAFDEWCRYQATGQLEELNRALEYWQKALVLTPPDSPEHPHFLNNLGTGLLIRYERTGALSDLERAITVCQQAVDTTPADSPTRPLCLTNLGGGLNTRYKRIGEPADLDAAITTFQQAAQATPSDSPGLPGRLNNLGNGLHDRYKRTREPADLDAAITTFQQAVQATPSDWPDRPAMLNNLGNGLHDRYKHTREPADLDAAITAYQQAVQASPSDSPDRPAMLNNLGGGLENRYAHTGELADLDAAITTFQQAVQASPSDSPDRPAMLGNLGAGLENRYAHTGELADLDAAITAWEEGWSLLHSHFADLPVVYQLGQQRQGVNIATTLVTAYLKRAARHPPHAQFDCRRALEVAEGSKSRLLTQLIGRGPLPLPTGLSSAVAVREQQLMAELTTLDTWELATHDRPVPAREEARPLNRLQRRQELWQELQQLWDGIAKMGEAGADYVALRRGDTPTWNDVARVAEDLGPATALLSFFTTADQVCLFVLRRGWPAPLVVKAPLDDAGWDDLYRRFDHEVVRYVPGRSLRETWEDPLRPLLDQTKAHLEGIERLVLVPEGYGHLLPWGVLTEHAGWRAPLGQPLSVVVLPALGVLPRLRLRPHVRSGPALIVGNPTGNLRYAKEEATTVASLFGVSPLLGAAATKATVLARLEQASLIHLSTHASFNPHAPLEARIALADDVLTAREVLEHRLHADLLVLSACESGLARSLGGEELAGLSQAFFQAGVRSLLVSLWPVNDFATAVLMSAFYTAWQAGADKAQALRQAMTQIQQNPHWTHPHYWGAFVLMGDWN